MWASCQVKSSVQSSEIQPWASCESQSSAVLFSAMLLFGFMSTMLTTDHAHSELPGLYHPFLS